MPRCATCALDFAAGERFCPTCGGSLDPASDAETASGTDDLIGRVLDGKYRLDEKIGEGGMGNVYRGRHVMMDRKVAVKIVRPEVASEENAARRFRREAKHSCRLDHENCVRVTDFGAEGDGLLYLVMEYLEGKTVGEEVYFDGPMAPRRVAHIGAQVCRALAHAHDLGIIHRDLKPDNIMLLRRNDDADWVKVLDFGLAKLLERADGMHAVTNPSLGSLTEAGIVFGTPEYMSPEQASGNPLDGRTDIYSLGVVMYQMLTGQLPFKGATFMAILTKHVTEPPLAPAARRPDLAIPIELDRLVMACLEKEPDRRPGSARVLGESLEAVATSLPIADARVPQQVAAAATIDLSSDSLMSGANTVATPVAEVSVAGLSMDNLPTEMTDPVPRTAAASPRRWLWLVAAISAVAAIGIAVATSDGGDADAPAVAPDARSAIPTPIDAGHRPLPDAAAPAAVAPTDAAPRPRSADRAPDPAFARHLAAAEAARRANNWLKVIVEANQALEIEPTDRRAAYLMGEAQLKSGEKTIGCQFLRRAKRYRPARTLYDSSACDSARGD